MKRACIRFLPAVVLVVTGLAGGVPGGNPLRAQEERRQGVPGDQDHGPERLPRFEVASVKPSKGPTGERGQPGGRYTATRTVKFFIADAFFFGTPLQMSRVIGGPEWIESALYEINAQASTAWQRSPDGPPRELFLMIRSLLQERFKLKTHMETRELPVYELVLARADRSLGPQLRQSTVCDARIAASRAGGPPPERQPNEPPPCGAMRGPARVLAGGIPMAQFANMLTLVMADANGPAGRDDARLVIDKTGLSGRFAFTLAWTPEQIPEGAPPPGIPPIDPNGPPLVTALQEQLGLKLQSARVPLEVVVIDSVEQPTPD
jgi:uncharacterized protein (TIGR03435 family)